MSSQIRLRCQLTYLTECIISASLFTISVSERNKEQNPDTTHGKWVIPIWINWFAKYMYRLLWQGQVFYVRVLGIFFPGGRLSPSPITRRVCFVNPRLTNRLAKPRSDLNIYVYHYWQISVFSVS